MTTENSHLMRKAQGPLQGRWALAIGTFFILRLIRFFRRRSESFGVAYWICYCRLFKAGSDWVHT